MKDDSLQEIIQQARQLEVKARRLVRESFAGEYHSSFKGQGLDFDDYREYTHGDEVRFIDWKVTARTGDPHIRTFREERELAVILAVDVSASGYFGSVSRSKLETAAMIAATLAFCAQHNGDKVGLLLFAEEPLLYLPPAKGRRQVLRILHEILTPRENNRGTNITAAADHLMRMIRRKSLIFLLSDFHDSDCSKALGTLASRHDLCAVRVLDPIEKSLPDIGRISVRDAETGFEAEINTSNRNLRSGYEKLMRTQRRGMSRLFRKYAIDSIDVLTHQDFMPALHRLFSARSRRR